MAVTGLLAAKVALAAASAAGIGIAAAHGNLQGLTTALSHVPAWTHAHSVLSQLASKR
ncbi:hypothetical protein ApAK_00590 [Thermoplasmatales archaeon AK]|nr:hypothetical protein [Thermoplasmatales archaeon AK]